MIVAEYSDLIIKSEAKNKEGSLSHSLGSFYNEFQIINFLGMDIQALDHKNQIAIIKPQEGAPVPREEDRCIIIQYRFAKGPRQIGSMAIEQTQSTFGRMTIPYRVLLDEPVFVEEINALFFCPLWHPHITLHPHSKEYVTQQHDRLRAEISRSAASWYNPITIMANDPTGQIKALHILLNGQICSVKVTNFNTDENETDVVAICIRSTTDGLIDDCKIIRTTFSELTKKNPLCWNIGGFLISSDRLWLEHKIEVDKVKHTPNVIPAEEVKTLLEQSKVEDAAVIASLNETIEHVSRDLKDSRTRYKSLKDSYEDLVSGGYVDRNSAAAFKKIELEEKKLHTAAEETRIKEKTERVKLVKEHITTIATVAKTIAVIIPLVVLYIKYKQSKNG